VCGGSPVCIDPKGANKIDAQVDSPREEQIGARVRIFLHYPVGVVLPLAVQPYTSNIICGRPIGHSSR